MTDRQLDRASFATLAVGLAGSCALALASAQLDVRGLVGGLVYAVIAGVPYGLAAVATRRLGATRTIRLGLLTAWGALVVASLAFLLDALVLRATDLSSLALLAVPVLQLPVVAVVSLAAWASRRP